MKLPSLIGIKLFLLKKALQKVVNKPAPRLIPRTGDEAKNVDFFSAEIRSLEGQYFDLQIDKITNEGFEGRLWNSKKDMIRKELYYLKILVRLNFLPRISWSFTISITNHL